MEKFHPLADRVLVEPEAHDQSKSGFLIPDSAIPKPQFGIVQEVGPQVIDKRIVVGARVNFKKHGGVQINLNGKSYRIVRESEIDGIFTTNQ
jgi:chaperonin GroES